jgi:hypothetical protein
MLSLRGPVMGWRRDRFKLPESPDQRRERRQTELIGGPIVGFFGGVMIVKSLQAYHHDGWLANLSFGPSDLPTWWILDMAIGFVMLAGGIWMLWSRLTER